MGINNVRNAAQIECYITYYTSSTSGLEARNLCPERSAMRIVAYLHQFLRRNGISIRHPVRTVVLAIPG